MATHDNAPPPDGWTCESRCCPFPDCQVCESDQQAIWRHWSDATIPPNVSLGEE